MSTTPPPSESDAATHVTPPTAAAAAPASPYAAPARPEYAPPALAAFAPAPAPSGPRAAGSSMLGLSAAIASLVALLCGSALAALAAGAVGSAIGTSRAAGIDGPAALTPARDWVLTGELGYWGATIVGILAVVLGIVAIARRRGRGWGIAAICIALAAPVIAGALAIVPFVIGIGAGVARSVGAL